MQIKTLADQFPAEFDATKISEAAMEQIIGAHREEAVRRVRKLVEKEYQTRLEEETAKKQLAKIQESLKKTTDTLALVRGGDLTPLFADDKKEETVQS